MTTDIFAEEIDPDMLRRGEEAALTEAAYGMSAERFAGLKVAERDTILFLLLREVAGSHKALEMRLDDFEAKVREYEDKAKELATPEGLQGLMSKFLGEGMGGMGMLTKGLGF